MTARMNTSPPPVSRTGHAALALLRVVYGLVLLTHGLPKALHLPHGSMGDPFASTTHLISNTFGARLAVPLTWAVTLLETLGAAMFAAGVLTRYVALAFAAEMIGIAIVMGPTWVWIDRGIEYPVMLAVIAACFAVRGGGHFSLDAMLGRRSTQPA